MRFKRRLTDERLIKLGGIKDDWSGYGGYLIYLPNGNSIRIKDNKWISGYIDVDMNYVSDLKRLYKILSGNRL